MRTPCNELRVSVDSLVERLFKFIPGNRAEQQRLIRQLLEGILLTHSPWLSHLARTFPSEGRSLIRIEQGISRQLGPRSGIAWGELESRATEIACFEVHPSDVIAFDPGDVIKEYAEKMDNLYRVHDGSRDECGWGYEEFAAEAVQWRDGRRFHIPLYEKLTNASFTDYQSQNFQIIQAVQSIYSNLGENRGIWTFDRAHDRGHLFSKVLLAPKIRMRWILRAKENRSCEPDDQRLRLPRSLSTGIMDIAQQLKLSDQPLQLRFPQTTAPLHIAFHSVKLAIDPDPRRSLSLVVVHDRRNEKPVILLSNIEVHSLEDALIVFGYYLERWRKEEGYRFLKTALHLERIRTLRWQRIQRLAWLEHLAYFYLTLFYRASPERVEAEIEHRLRHFRPISEIHFRYYRVAQLVQILLAEQRGQTEVREPMTEVA